MAEQDKAPIRVTCERRNRELDPQPVWRGNVQCIHIEPPYGNRFNSNIQ